MQAQQASLKGTLDQEINRLWSAWDQVEEDLFSRFNDDPARQANQCLEHDLFWVIEGQVLPAYLRPATNLIDRAEATFAFTRGKEAMTLGDKTTAIDAFADAANTEVTDRDDLYRKVSAMVNVLDLSSQPRLPLVLEILALLDRPSAIQLSTTQTAFFDEWIGEQNQDYARLRARSRNLWAMTEKIEQTISLNGAATRTLLGDRMLSKNADGEIVLDHAHWQERWSPTNPVEWGKGPPGDLAAHHVRLDFFNEPIYAWIPLKTLIDRQQTERSRYTMAKIILHTLVAASLLLTIGIYRARKKERQLEALRSAFISTVSHELRTPLSLIRLYAETLYHDRIKPEKRKEYHQTMLIESERLGGLVNNVLDFSRLSRDDHSMACETIDVSRSCEQIIESFRFRFEKEEVILHCEIEEGLTASIDPIGLSQVLFNLLDNAIKYSEDSKSIWFSATRKDQHIELRVADNGIGIPSEFKRRIFNEFARGSDQRVTAQRGSGIGLHVARALTEAMSGTIRVADQTPQGSIFIVAFPEVKPAAS